MERRGEVEDGAGDAKLHCSKGWDALLNPRSRLIPGLCYVEVHPTATSGFIQLQKCGTIYS
jgi:hypothetical protein